MGTCWCSTTTPTTRAGAGAGGAGAGVGGAGAGGARAGGAEATPIVLGATAVRECNSKYRLHRLKTCVYSIQRQKSRKLSG